MARGLPIVLMMHTPLYTQALCAHAMEELHQPCAYLVGAPEECLTAYPRTGAFSGSPRGIPSP